MSEIKLKSFDEMPDIVKSIVAGVTLSVAMDLYNFHYDICVNGIKKHEYLIVVFGAGLITSRLLQSLP